MKALFILILSCLSCFAQFGVEQPFFSATTAAGYSPPSTNINLYRWWVASDTPAGQTISNQWVDKISSAYMKQMNISAAPTNSLSGMRYSGSQKSTNDPVNVSSVYPRFAIFAVINTDGESADQVVLANYNEAYGIYVNGSTLRYGGTASGGPNNICTIPTGTRLDIAAVFTTTNTLWYTNGILAKSNSTPATDSMVLGSIGHNSAYGNYWKGYLTELLFYTNMLSTAQVSYLHEYQTNKYGYTP